MKVLYLIKRGSTKILLKCRYKIEDKMFFPVSVINNKGETIAYVTLNG